MRARLLLPCVVLVACATAAPLPEGPPPLRPAARSSLDAVLSHGAELGLTDDQKSRLQALDDERERKASELHAELQAMRGDGQAGSQHRGPGNRGGPASGTGAPGGLPQGGMGSGAMGGGRGSGGMGRMGGRGGGGPAMGPQGPQAPGPQQVWLRLDDLDTQAYLSAEGLFTEAQREPAAIIATRYREELFNFREAMRKRRLEAE